MLEGLALGIAMLISSGFSTYFADEQLYLEDLLHDVNGKESWYQVTFDDFHIGSFVEVHTKKETGFIEVKRTLNFKLTTDRETLITTTLRFVDESPYELVHASESTEIQTLDATHQFNREYLPQTLKDSEDTTFTYLSTMPFHPRLVNENTSQNVASIDFESQTIKTEVWYLDQLDQQSRTTHWVNESRDSTQTIATSGELQQSVTSSNINLHLVDRASAQRFRQNQALLGATEIAIPTDVAIKNHKELKALKLRIVTDAPNAMAWNEMVNEQQEINIDRTELEKIKRLPKTNSSRSVDESAINTFLNMIEIPQTASKLEQIEYLINQIHDELSYEEINYPTTVAETLKRKTGDCTEFADLFHVAARKLGWATRTRHGFAYDANSQSFRVHMWNEVDLDGFWLPVDATWNQIRADATHVPFPHANTLALLHDASNLQFEVLEQRH